MFTTTFYSFKGGVGRTLALMNVAYYLTSRGNNVTVVDFDLEAPGMQTFDLFDELISKDEKLKVKGVADYVNEYKQSCQTNNPQIPKIDNFIYKVPDDKIISKGINKKGSLWFVPASQSLKKEVVQDINWEKIYTDYDGYLLFEEFKLQISKKTKSDYLFIDSRTGLTDHSSICTKQFPDLLISLFFPNDQNIDGLKEITDDVRSFKKNNASIPIHFVASRIPIGDDEDNIIEKQLQKAKNKLKYFVNDDFSEFFELSHNPNFELMEQKLMVTK